jgi:hypothetical protein
MTWLMPSGEKAWIPVVHSFFAYSPNGCHGQILGVATSPSEGSKDMYFQTSGGGDGPTLFLQNPSTFQQYLRLGRVFRDGIQTDPCATIDKSATQLVETEAYRPDAMAEAFFNFKNYQAAAGSYSYGNRVGGGRIHEVLIFTNALSEIDRILVEQRLLRKWIKTSGYSIPPEITVASGATLTLPAAVAGATKVKSEGTLRCPGAVVSTLDAPDPFAVTGSVELDAGATVSNRALFAVAPQSGKTYAVDAWNTLAVSGGTAGQTDKTGIGSLALAGFGGATKFSVSEGLASVHVAPGLSKTVAKNCIADGGFEGIWSGTSYNTYADGTQIGDSAWHVTNFFSSAETRIIYKTGWSYMWASGKVLGTPEGDYFLLFKMGGGARQSFSVEKAGRHEVRLRCYPRSSGYGNSAFARVYVDGHSLGTVQCRSGEDDWDVARLVTPYLEAGDHVLALMSEVTTDNAIGIDDVHVTLLDEERDSPAVANGNFEDIDWAVIPERVTIGYTIDGNQETNRIMSTAFMKGWTATGAAYLLRRLPYLRSSSDFIGPDNDNGCVSIALTNGTVLSQSVTIPATGFYRLHAKAARYKHPVAKAYVGEPTDATTCKMSLAVGGTSEAFAITGWALADFAMAQAVLLQKGDVVTISVTSTDWVDSKNNPVGNTIVVDDVRLVRADNLVCNGGFEAGSDSASELAGWTLVANPQNTQLRYSGCQMHFGAEPVEGVARCRIHAGTHIAQTIPLDAGYYRLSFWNVSRSEFNTPANAFKVQYGPAAITVTLANGSVTNFCETVVSSSNCVEFIRREFLVKVEAAGNWTLGFEGETANEDISSFIDAVSLRPASGVEANAVPAAAKDVELSIAAAASLQLDYDGVLDVGRIRCGGRSFVEEHSAATIPNLRGIGRLHASPRGLCIIIK